MFVIPTLEFEIVDAVEDVVGIDVLIAAVEGVVMDEFDDQIVEEVATEAFDDADDVDKDELDAKDAFDEGVVVFGKLVDELSAEDTDELLGEFVVEEISVAAIVDEFFEIKVVEDWVVD